MVGSLELARRAGITYRQLDHWLSIGLVWPSHPAHGSGTYVGWQEEDAAWVVAVGRLVNLGVAPHAILDAIRRDGSPALWAAEIGVALAGVLDAVPEWAGDPELVGA
jgi:DNA-binding transcriptional MerR regulator